MEEVATIISPDTLRSNRVPPNQRLVTDWPVLHYGGVPRINIASWTITISCLVHNPQTLSFESLQQLPRVKVHSDIHCVTGWSRLDNLWEGVGSKEIARLVRPRPEARFAIIHAAAGFTTNLPIDEFLQDDVLFAVSHDGRPLTAEHGGPVRLVVPRLYFWKSAKWVTGVQFVAEDEPGFWESNGYHNHGDPWLEERYSR